MVGIPLGLLIGMSPTADLLTSPYLWGFFAMPRIALAPLMILWFGFGDGDQDLARRACPP